MAQSASEQVSERISVGARGRRLGRWFRRMGRTQPLGVIGGSICLFIVLMALFAPVVDRYGPFETSPLKALNPPSTEHWFGTDGLGRDLYSRIIHGARVSLYVSFFSIGLGTSIGYLLGIFSGYVGGKVDMVIQRVVDAMLAFPSILLALSIVAVLGGGLDKVITAISVTLAPRASRVARGVVLSLKENVYVDAARVIGASPVRIMLLHIAPNSMAAYLILASVALGGAILVEASLSFLGLGVPPPHPSWGRELAGSAQEVSILAPWLMIAPGIAIMVLVLAFNLLGDSLRDIWDPKLRSR